MFERKLKNSQKWLDGFDQMNMLILNIDIILNRKDWNRLQVLIQLPRHQETKKTNEPSRKKCPQILMKSKGISSSKFTLVSAPALNLEANEICTISISTCRSLDTQNSFIQSTLSYSRLSLYEQFLNTYIQLPPTCFQ